MADTAITKAIEQLSEYRDTYNPMCDEFTIINKCIDELTDLLPYERETIEAAYRQGDYDCGQSEFGSVAEFRNGNDYFTKTYNQ